MLLCDVMSYDVMLCMLCCAMLCHAVLCHVKSYDVTLGCYVMFVDVVFLT